MATEKPLSFEPGAEKSFTFAFDSQILSRLKKLNS